MSQGDPRDPRRGPPPPWGHAPRPVPSPQPQPQPTTLPGGHAASAPPSAPAPAPGPLIPPTAPPPGPAPIAAAPPSGYPAPRGAPPPAGYPPYQQPAGYPPYQQPAGYPPHQQPAGYPPYQQPAGYPPPGYPQPGHPPPGYPPPGYPPYRHAPAPPRPAAPPGHGFFPFLRLSFLRAIRLRIDPDEVLPAERAALERAGVTEPTFQAFLAWRRSILFVVATLLVPLIALKAYEIYGEDSEFPDAVAETLRTLHTLPLLAEVAFCVLAWIQLRNWTQWRRQRRALAWGWAVFFIAPFIVYLYPMRSLAGDIFGEMPPAQAKALSLLLGLGFSLQAMMTLAPKAVSLIPGMVRAATVTKLLFPGSAAPGWLIVLGAPIYAMFIYVVLIVPYQLTGSGYFVVTILGIIGAEILLGRGGYLLARPLTRAEAITAVRRARLMYFVALLISVLFMVLALGELVEQLDWNAITVINLVFTFITNVWILTLITTDVLIAGLDRARGLTAGTQHLADDFDRQLATFIGQKTVAMDAVAPPPGVDVPP